MFALGIDSTIYAVLEWAIGGVLKTPKIMIKLQNKLRCETNFQRQIKYKAKDNLEKTKYLKFSDQRGPTAICSGSAPCSTRFNQRC